jgi:hemerythrin
MKLRWLDSMSVGVAEFDNDHRQMLQLMADISTDLGQGKEKPATQRIIDLQALTRGHIVRERAFLQHIGFPRLEVAIAAQEELLSHIAALKAVPRKDANAMISDMEEAFVTYLLRGDVNYKSFVEFAGLSDVPSFGEEEPIETANRIAGSV